MTKSEIGVRGGGRGGGGGVDGNYYNKVVFYLGLVAIAWSQYTKTVQLYKYMYSMH